FAVCGLSWSMCTSTTETFWLHEASAGSTATKIAVDESELDHSAKIDRGLLKPSADTPRFLEPPNETLDDRAPLVSIVVEVDGAIVSVLIRSAEDDLPHRTECGALSQIHP